MIGLVPYKGQILNQLSAWWFGQTADIIPNHFISAPDPNVTIARESKPILLEVVVRGYITGVTRTSLWARYEAGERTIYGLDFPNGLKKNQLLQTPVITPNTKANEGQDVRLTTREVVESGYLDVLTWDRIRSAALALFQRGQALAERGGLILVDTKYEFGIDSENGDLLLIDEIHTPDSSRFWNAHTYADRIEMGLEPENFDKELVRLWYIAQGYRGSGDPPPMSDEIIIATSERYQSVYERLTGNEFEPASYPVDERIEALMKTL